MSDPFDQALRYNQLGDLTLAFFSGRKNMSSAWLVKGSVE